MQEGTGNAMSIASDVNFQWKPENPWTCWAQKCDSHETIRYSKEFDFNLIQENIPERSVIVCMLDWSTQ